MPRALVHVVRDVVAAAKVLQPSQFGVAGRLVRPRRTRRLRAGRAAIVQQVEHRERIVAFPRGHIFKRNLSGAAGQSPHVCPAGLLQTAGTGYEPEGREFDSLRARHSLLFLSLRTSQRNFCRRHIGVTSDLGRRLGDNSAKLFGIALLNC